MTLVPRLPLYRHLKVLFYVVCVCLLRVSGRSRLNGLIFCTCFFICAGHCTYRVILKVHVNNSRTHSPYCCARSPKFIQLVQCLYVCIYVHYMCLYVHMPVVIQLEGSSKWPTDPAAISSVKTSFYTFLSRALSDQCLLLSCPNKHHLDILKVSHGQLNDCLLYTFIW